MGMWSKLTQPTQGVTVDPAIHVIRAGWDQSHSGAARGMRSSPKLVNSLRPTGSRVVGGVLEDGGWGNIGAVAY